MVPRTLIIGHRGASLEAPENTLSSFRLAFEQGADGVEADFRLTGDGEIVCLHDDGTARTAGVDLRVEEATLSELRLLDVGAWKGARWAGERIPTLQEVLCALPAGKMLFIELKSGPEIVSPLAALLAGSGVPAAQIRLLCFSADLIRLLKERLPDYRACWLTDYRFRGAWRPSPRELLDSLEASRADGLASRDRAVLDASLVLALRAHSMEIHVWTVDAASAGRRLCALGVDSVMTNRPGWLRRSLSEPLPPGQALPEERAGEL
ncbi:MAG: glycerophosphodiester phosphodiesterase [Geobacteraceae bacterium GWC2_58_44]|nr:MAG: glycerophosphodiester phosphodiesterase [Geobacteraceae bacterium GWC2_58_44]HBG04706.1 glycerophosphodiester phosphodiesterase [Geobacter sp.]